ncbi:hypothetical protein ACLOJK_014685 [Asimina triloba]
MDARAQRPRQHPVQPRSTMAAVAMNPNGKSSRSWCPAPSASGKIEIPIRTSWQQFDPSDDRTHVWADPNHGRRQPQIDQAGHDPPTQIFLTFNGSPKSSWQRASPSGPAPHAQVDHQQPFAPIPIDSNPIWAEYPSSRAATREAAPNCTFHLHRPHYRNPNSAEQKQKSRAARNPNSVGHGTNYQSRPEHGRSMLVIHLPIDFLKQNSSHENWTTRRKFWRLNRTATSACQNRPICRSAIAWQPQIERQHEGWRLYHHSTQMKQQNGRNVQIYNSQIAPAWQPKPDQTHQHRPVQARWAHFSTPKFQTKSVDSMS